MGGYRADELLNLLSALNFQALSQIHSVIFGLDIIGNPSMLFKNFELGVSDLVDKSRAGFERSTAVSGVTGVAVGVKELLGHVIGVYLLYIHVLRVYHHVCFVCLSVMCRGLLVNVRIEGYFMFVCLFPGMFVCHL